MNLLTGKATYKPFRYPWAYEAWKAQQSMHWLPEEVPMADAPAAEDTDIADEEVPLADAEESIIAETGDSNHMAAGFGGMFAALAGMMMLKRRKEN